MKKSAKNIWQCNVYKVTFIGRNGKFKPISFDFHPHKLKFKVQGGVTRKNWSLKQFLAQNRSN